MIRNGLRSRKPAPRPLMRGRGVVRVHQRDRTTGSGAEAVHEQGLLIQRRRSASAIVTRPGGPWIHGQRRSGADGDTSFRGLSGTVGAGPVPCGSIATADQPLRPRWEPGLRDATGTEACRPVSGCPRPGARARDRGFPAAWGRRLRASCCRRATWTDGSARPNRVALCATRAPTGGLLLVPIRRLPGRRPAEDPGGPRDRPAARGPAASRTTVRSPDLASFPRGTGCGVRDACREVATPTWNTATRAARGPLREVVAGY